MSTGSPVSGHLICTIAMTHSNLRLRRHSGTPARASDTPLVRRRYRPRTLAIGHMAAGLVFIGIGVAGLIDSGLLDGTLMAAILFLSLGVMSAVAVRAYWSAHRRSAQASA